MEIFGNIEEIFECNTKFLSDVEHHVFAPDFDGNAPLHGMFARLVGALEKYPDYVKNHSTSIATVNKKMASQSFATFLQVFFSFHFFLFDFDFLFFLFLFLFLLLTYFNYYYYFTI